MSSFNLFSKEVVAEVSPQLKQLRLKRQLSIEELQVATHISARLLKRMEDGKCLTYSHLHRLLDFYGKKLRIVIED